MARRGRPRHPDILTPREWGVLALLRDGFSNEEIAERLDITVRTARYHVSEILSKLNVSSREEAAAWQPEERRSWWATAFGPVLPAKRMTAAIIAGALVVGIGVAALVLFWYADHSNDGQPVASAEAVLPTAVPVPIWNLQDERISVVQPPSCGDIATAAAYGVPRTLEYDREPQSEMHMWLGLEAVPYQYVAAQIRPFGGNPWSAAGWEVSQRPNLIWSSPAGYFPPELFLRRLDQPDLVFRYGAEYCNQADRLPGDSALYSQHSLDLPVTLPNIIVRREGDYLSPQEVIGVVTRGGPTVDVHAKSTHRVVWAELGNSLDFVGTRNEDLHFPPLRQDPEQVYWVVLVALGDDSGPQRPGHEIGYYYQIDPVGGGIWGYGCCIDLVFSP